MANTHVGHRCEYQRLVFRWPFGFIFERGTWRLPWLWRVPLILRHERCDNEGLECALPWSSGDDPAKEPELIYYCHRHIFDEGFCQGCGQFWAGVESFDFSPNGLCENCREDDDFRDDRDNEDDFDFIDYLEEVLP